MAPNIRMAPQVCLSLLNEYYEDLILQENEEYERLQQLELDYEYFSEMAYR